MSNDKKPVINKKRWIENFIKIINKNQELVSLKLNNPQKKLLRLINEVKMSGKPVRVIILKARQLGFSTFIEALGASEVTTKKNKSMAVIAHKSTATEGIYSMFKRMYENLPNEIRPETETSNIRGMIFKDFNSSVKVLSAEDREAGRSNTFSLVHMSEIAFWPNARQTYVSLMQSVPKTDDTYVFIESTPNGFDYFRELWNNAEKNGFVRFFAAWFDNDEYSMDLNEYESKCGVSGFKINEDVATYGDERSLKEMYDLTNEQLMWRRWCIGTNCGGDKEIFRQEYPSNDVECFLSSGTPTFNVDKVTERLEWVRKNITPMKQGYFKYELAIDKDTNKPVINDGSISWVEDDTGYIKIIEEPKKEIVGARELRTPYVIGGDTALKGEDYFTASVVNNITYEDVASLRLQNMNDDEYAYQVYCLSKYYNDAKVGIETNINVYVTTVLNDLGVSQYVRENPDSVNVYMDSKLGFRTTTVTRPNMISSFKALVNSTNIKIINDEKTLEEMLTFQKIDGKDQAVSGEHDDMLMARMIAHMVGQQSEHAKEETEIEVVENDFIKENFKRDYMDYSDEGNGGVDEW